MKNLIDGTEVTDRSYYFLLDWNEQNEWEYIFQKFNKAKLKSLTKDQYKQVFEHATKMEAQNM